MASSLLLRLHLPSPSSLSLPSSRNRRPPRPPPPPPPSSPLFLCCHDRSSSSPPPPSSSSSSSTSSSSSSVPRMEPFNRSRISRIIPEPSLIDKAEHAIADRCSTLEGDEAYDCWEALFEFEKMKHDYTEKCDVASSEDKLAACQPLDRLGNLVRQSGGVASLIDNVRMLSKANEIHGKVAEEEAKPITPEDDKQQLHFFPEPDSLPPSKEDLELQESARMPESPFTRVLRKMGSHSSPYQDSEPL